MKPNFPLDYRLGGGWRNSLLVVGALMAIGGLVGVLFAGEMSEFFSGQMLMAGICLGFALLGVYLVLGMLRMRVVLNSDSIELHGVFKKRTLLRNDIAGRRLVPMQHGPPAIRLDPRRESLSRAMVLPQFLTTDAAFEAWFEAIPDQDAIERKESLDTYLKDAELDGSKDEKLARLAGAEKVARVLMYVSIAIGIWVWFKPQPYAWAVGCTAVLPWVALFLAARGKGIYRFNPSPNDVGADVSIALLFPGLALLIRALFDIHVFDQMKILWIALAGTGVCVLLFAWLVPELRARSAGVFIVGVVMATYSYGAATLANTLFDHSDSIPYTAKVLNARISTGKSTSYYLTLSPWGPSKESEEVDVGQDLYERTRKGDTVCVYLSRGALEVRWFDVWSCPRG